MDNQCWWCQKHFRSDEVEKAKDELLVCPHCGGWTGPVKLPIPTFEVLHPVATVQLHLHAPEKKLA